MVKSLYVCDMEKKNQRKQFLYNTDWYYNLIGDELIDSLKDDEYFLVEQGLLGAIVKFQTHYLFNDEIQIFVLENTTNDEWKKHIKKHNEQFMWPCQEEKLQNIVIDLFVDEVLPEMIKNEKKYRAKKIKTLQDQINKLQQEIDNA